MDDSVLMDFSKLPYTEFSFEIISVIRQYWDDNNSWTEFMYTPRNSSAFLMVVSDTTVRYTDNSGDTFTAKNGDIIYCPFGGKYKFEIISPANSDRYGKVKTLCVNFNMIRPDKKIITLSRKPIKVVNFKSVQLENDFFDISKYTLKPMMRKYKLCKIMKTVIDIYSNDSENFSVLRDAVQYLEDHYAENFKMSFLAEKFNLSESYFRKLFRDFTGLSPVEYRNGLRVEHAKELLSRNAVSVSEVARAVGIEDQFYFSRIFKESEGISPLRYKKSFDLLSQK
ncbi:MAG: AraC family transcriptional regulator [Acutalibacteraceae bacterium]|nr:AraC family transcriptional regulator [Acutalibacteraceae bacterium]